MCDLEKWMNANKKICVLTGIFGLLLAPFLWPFFLAILFEGLSVALPLTAAWFFIKQLRKEKEETNEKIREEHSEKKNADTDPMHTDSAQTDDLSQERKDTRPESTAVEKDTIPDDKSCLAIAWYQQEGRERILRIREKAEKEGKKEFSISKDGICSVRLEKGFQRVGVLRGYPGTSLLSASTQLEKDGFRVKTVREFVWISWKRGSGYAV